MVGKTASCAAMALTVGAYLWPAHRQAVAVASVVVIAAVNLGGLTRTVALTRLLPVVSLAALAAVVVAGWSSPAADLGRLAPLDGNALDIVQSAGFLFFAFAGYVRIATLGEEVRDPEVTIPKAVPLALGGVLVIYAIVGVTVLAVVPAAVVADSPAPLQLVVEAGRFDGVTALTRFGGGFAALGVLLNLIPGVSRTALSLARRHELPHVLAHIDPNRSLPLRAEMTVTAVIVALVVALDLRTAIGFSGVAVLSYYAITNASALTLTAAQRRWPRPVAGVGLVGCVSLILALPASAVLSGTIVLLIGVAVRLVTLRAAGSIRR